MKRTLSRLAVFGTVSFLFTACGTLPTNPERLARDLVACAEDALDEARYELAASCLKTAATLTRDEKIAAQLVHLEKRREREEAEANARAKARREVKSADQQAQQTRKVDQLKVRYQQLYGAGWWQAARDVLSQLRSRAPRDPDVIAWSGDLRVVLAKHVAAELERGQALYSQGQLHQALAVWRDAAKLAPDDTVLQAHIARVERFITKLERLEKDDDA